MINDEFGKVFSQAHLRNVLSETWEMSETNNLDGWQSSFLIT